MTFVGGTCNGEGSQFPSSAAHSFAHSSNVLVSSFYQLWTLQDEQVWSDAIENHFIEHVGQCSIEENLAITTSAIEAIPFGC